MFLFARKTLRTDWPVDNLGRTELHVAALQGDAKMLQKLFKEGAQTVLHTKDNQGNTALHLMAQGVDGIPEQYEQGEKDARWYAEKARAYEKAMQVLLKQPVYLNAPNQAGETPLHLAVRVSRQISLIEMLINAGAAVDRLDAQGNSVLHWAVSVRKATFNVTQYLLRYPRVQHLVNHKNNYEQAPLHLVVSKEPYPDQALVFQALLTAGAAVDVPNVEFETALHLATWRGDRDQIISLLAKTNQINAKDAEGNTPLHKALLAGQRDEYDLLIIEQLLKAGADPEQLNYRLQTPRQLAQSIPRLRVLLTVYPENPALITLSQKEQLEKMLVDIMLRQTHLRQLYQKLQSSQMGNDSKSLMDIIIHRYEAWFPTEWSEWPKQPLPDIRLLCNDRDQARQALLATNKIVHTVEQQLRQHRALWDLAQEQNSRRQDDEFLKSRIEELKFHLDQEKAKQDFYQVFLAQWPYYMQRPFIQHQWEKAFYPAEESFNQRFRLDPSIKKTSAKNNTDSVRPNTDSTKTNARVLQERPLFNLIHERLSGRYQTLRRNTRESVVVDSLQVLLDIWNVPKTIQYGSDDDQTLKEAELAVGEVLAEEKQREDLLLAEHEALKQQIVELQQQLAYQQFNQSQSSRLQAELKEMKEQQQLLWNEYAVKMDYQEGLKRFQEHPNLFLFYRTVQIKLEELFVGFKAIASGLVDPPEGQLAAAKSIAEFFGDVASVVPLIGDAIKLMSKWGIGKVIKKIDQVREKNAAIQASELLTLSEVKKTAERTARALTLRYEDQLKRLATPEKEAKFMSQLQRGINKITAAITRSKTLPGAKQMAAFAVLTMLEALQSGKIQEDKPIDEQFIRLMPQANQEVQAVWSLLSNPLQLAPLLTANQSSWSVIDIYTKPGVKVLGESPQQPFTYYQGKGANSEIYGYRLGTLDEVKALNWQLVEAPIISSGINTFFQMPPNSPIGSLANALVDNHAANNNITAYKSQIT